MLYTEWKNIFSTHFKGRRFADTTARFYSSKRTLLNVWKSVFGCSVGCISSNVTLMVHYSRYFSFRKKTAEISAYSDINTGSIHVVHLFCVTLHTSALFCSVAAGSLAWVLSFVSSMPTNFSLRYDTSSIRSSFWVSREVLLISSWEKHTLPLWVTSVVNHTRAAFTNHTYRRRQHMHRYRRSTLWEVSMLLQSVQCSSHTNRSGEAGGPDPTELNIHTHTQAS